MANKTKLREILAILSPDGTNADFKAFDEGVDKLKKGLKEKIQVKTLEDVNGQLRRVKEGMNLEPLLTAIKDIDRNFDTRIREVASALADEVSKFDELSKAEREEHTGKLAESSGTVDSLRNQLETLKTQKDKEMSDVIEALKGIPALKAENETVFNEIKSRLDALEIPEEDEPDLITPVAQRVEEVRSELISKIASTNHGDHANRNIAIGSNTSVLSRYTDLNLIAGANTTITYAYNDTTKYTDVTLASSGGGGGGSVAAAGSNTQIQYNDNGNFGASSTFTWNKNTSIFTAYGQTFLGQPGIAAGSTGTAFNTFTSDLVTNPIVNSFQAIGSIASNGTIQALQFNATDNGGNNTNTIQGINGLAIKSGNGSIATLIAIQASPRLFGAANATVMEGYRSQVRVPAGTAAATAINFSATAPTSGGSIQAAYGFRTVTMKVNGVASAYGIGTDGPTDVNYFLGTVGVGVQNPGAGARLQVGLQGSVAGNIRMAGSTAGTVQLQPASIAGDWTMTLPTGTGSAGQYLQTDGAGITQWASVTASGGSGITRSINNIAVNTSVAASANVDYAYFASGNIAVNLPNPVGNTNLYTVKNTGAGVVTIDTVVAHTIDGSPTAILPVQFTSVDILSNGADWLII